MALSAIDYCPVPNTKAKESSLSDADARARVGTRVQGSLHGAKSEAVVSVG